jgi:hypothetical protein
LSLLLGEEEGETEKEGRKYCGMRKMEPPDPGSA